MKRLLVLVLLLSGCTTTVVCVRDVDISLGSSFGSMAKNTQPPKN